MARLHDNTALLVIDVQHGFSRPAWGERNNPAAESNIAALLNGFRERGLRVIHIRHDSPSPGGLLRRGTPDNEPMPCAREIDGEAVHHKSVNSAFIGTRLEESLREAGVKAIVIIGLTTNHCVSTTARIAGNLGFDTYVVSDATAAFARPHLDGTMRSAEDVHRAALSDLDEEFATVTDTTALLDRLPAPLGS